MWGTGHAGYIRKVERVPLQQCCGSTLLTKTRNGLIKERVFWILIWFTFHIYVLSFSTYLSYTKTKCNEACVRREEAERALLTGKAAHGEKLFLSPIGACRAITAVYRYRGPLLNRDSYKHKYFQKTYTTEACLLLCSTKSGHFLPLPVLLPSLLLSHKPFSDFLSGYPCGLHSRKENRDFWDPWQ